MEQQPNKRYETLILPIDYAKTFLDFSKDEIQKCYQWFLSIKNDRLRYLCNFLFEQQDNCLKEENLNVIEMFLLSSVSTIPKPRNQFDSELEKVPLHMRSFAPPDDYLLDDKTISICYDVGIFLGELIIQVDRRIYWTLENDDNYADYGQPILIKKEVLFRINPFMVAKNASVKIYEGRYKDGDLVGFFNTWKKAFKV